MWQWESPKSAISKIRQLVILAAAGVLALILSQYAPGTAPPAASIISTLLTSASPLPCPATTPSNGNVCR